MKTNKYFSKVQKHSPVPETLFNKVVDFQYATLLKRDFGARAFLWIQRDSKNTCFVEYMWMAASESRSSSG